MDLVNAQQARRALDYLVGFNLSPLLWKKIRRGLSAGRVQSPALRLIVRARARDRGVQDPGILDDPLRRRRRTSIAFTAPPHALRGREARPVRGAATPRATTRSSRFLEAHAQRHGEGPGDREEAQARSPAAPFTTSTLQQEAVRKLGFSTDRAMKVAQSLYEGVNIGRTVTGLITYMRTDSVTLSKEAMTEIRGFITKNYGAGLPAEGAGGLRATSRKNAQEAHEAIRPTSITRTPDSVARVPERRAAQALRDDLEARGRLADDAGAVRHGGGGLHRRRRRATSSAPPARR